MVLTLLVGTLTAAMELLWLLAATPCLALPRLRPEVLEASARIASFEARRLGMGAGGYNGVRAHRYLSVRWAAGVLGGLVLLTLGVGAGTGLWLVTGWLAGESPDGIEPTAPVVIYIAVLGTVLLFLNLTGIAGVVTLERWLVTHLLRLSPTEILERRIAELAETRAGIVAAVDVERRRIERDLHDGLQQRLVALAMLIGRARRGRSPELLDDLLRQAHEDAQQALSDLREVAWRVYPSALDSLGLREALAGVAERSAVPVRISYDLDGRPTTTVETAAYFVVCEAVTNAAKHAGADLITVRVASEEGRILVQVIDDGKGGAVLSGSGLSGLARRVAALDGHFSVISPAGGPTVVTAELLCASAAMTRERSPGPDGAAATPERSPGMAGWS
ncbi:sensor histidine kinase [Planobispora longispora]|nr:histidine kinase [Planobispora longispora]